MLAINPAETLPVAQVRTSARYLHADLETADLEAVQPLVRDRCAKLVPGRRLSTRESVVSPAWQNT
jgi:hypothetical protein